MSLALSSAPQGHLHAAAAAVGSPQLLQAHQVYHPAVNPARPLLLYCYLHGLRLPLLLLVLWLSLSALVAPYYCLMVSALLLLQLLVYLL